MISGTTFVLKSQRQSLPPQSRKISQPSHGPIKPKVTSVQSAVADSLPPPAKLWGDLDLGIPDAREQGESFADKATADLAGNQKDILKDDSLMIPIDSDIREDEPDHRLGAGIVEGDDDYLREPRERAKVHNTTIRR
jgi:hypothetical protein